MKICLTLSGEPREYENTYYALGKFCKKYSVDVFIHSWNEYTKPSTNDGVGEVLKKEYNLKKKLIDAYDPVWIKTEKKNKCIDYLKTYHIPHMPVDYTKYITTNYASVCQWYSTQEATRLKMCYEKENNFKYDIQIKTRFDTFFIDSPDLYNWYTRSILENDTDLFVGWLNLNKGIMSMEYSTIIGKNEAQDQLWGNILQDITKIGNFGQINPHEQIFDYCKKLKLSIKDGVYITQLARNIVRPNINSNKLKEGFETGNIHNANMLIKKAYNTY